MKNMNNSRINYIAPEISMEMISGAIMLFLKQPMNQI